MIANFNYTTATSRARTYLTYSLVSPSQTLSSQGAYRLQIISTSETTYSQIVVRRCLIDKQV